MKLINSNRFYLKGTDNHFIHLATITEGFKEFMCFANVFSNQVYIEEISGGHLEFITDDNLATELSNFLTEKRILSMGQPLLPDKQWYKK